MRLPNGYGCIRKLTGNRRKPYHVSKKVGEIVDDKTQKARPRYVTIGYTETKAEALQLLAAYNKTPYDLEHSDITFKEVFDEYIAIKSETASDSRINGFRSVVKYFEPIYHRTFRTLKTRDFEGLAKDMPRTTRILAKDLLSQVYKHALRYEYCTRDYSKLISITLDSTPQTRRNVFTKEEIDRLWQNKDNSIVKMILLSLYSGIRPAELYIITVDNVFIEERYFITGVKTENGKNRRVPIHKDVYDLICEVYKEAVDNGQTYLFENNHAPFSRISYPHRFKAIMGESHTPYDTRHSFITFAKMSNINEYILKRIVGHSIADITERVYTHITVDALVSEMDKVKVG